MIEKEEGGRNNLIKLNIDELEGPEHQSVTQKSIENKDKSEISHPDYSSINNQEIKLEEEENNNNDSNSNNNNANNSVSHSKQNYKSSQKKTKNRRSRLAIDPNEDFCAQHTKKVYTEEEKIKKAIDNGLYFNSCLITNRNDLNIHFLKRKIEQNYEREDKLQIFFNVPFFPKEEMFAPRQLAKNNQYLYNINRNNQYNMQNKIGIIPNRNVNYPNTVRYMNNINNNNLKLNNNINLGKISNSNNNANNISNISNNNINNKINNNINLGKNQNNNINLGINKINNSSNNNINNTIKNNNNINIVNNSKINNQINKNNITYNIINNSSNTIKITKPILDTTLFKDLNNNYISSTNKNEGNIVNKKNGVLFALKTNIQTNIKNNEKDSSIDINDFKNNNIENKEMNNNGEKKEEKKTINHFEPIRKIDLGSKKLGKEKDEKDKKENKNENNNKKLYNVIREN